ncbi:hypothetical protein AAC387_Pa01g1834 [Persea americana]
MLGIPIPIMRRGSPIAGGRTRDPPFRQRQTKFRPQIFGKTLAIAIASPSPKPDEMPHGKGKEALGNIPNPNLL